jgi:beta-phosphoglucomutase-like phosphatase (HAD superfamily)
MQKVLPSITSPNDIFPALFWPHTSHYFYHPFQQHHKEVTDLISSRPQNYMFKLMRDALGIDKSVDILDHCHSLPPAEEAAALEKVRTIEREAMTSQEPQPGIIPLMEYIDSFNIPKAICTRNFDLPVNHLLTKFLPSFEFFPSASRLSQSPLSSIDLEM